MLSILRDFAAFNGTLGFSASVTNFILPNKEYSTPYPLGSQPWLHFGITGGVLEGIYLSPGPRDSDFIWGYGLSIRKF